MVTNSVKPRRHSYGSSKGSTFERKICRLISKFWSDGQRKDLCWRSAASGARGTVTRTQTKGFHGDIVATDPLIAPFFNVFSVECKHYNEFDLSELLRGIKNNRLLIFWRQTLKSAVLSKRIPILIVKSNFIPELFVVRLGDALSMVQTMNRKLPFITAGQKLAVFNLDEFFKNVNREKFIGAVQTIEKAGVPWRGLPSVEVGGVHF